ncbi:hypothetical protein AYK26_07175 [Euryarchaeota archaeon SM23-78]|nr:MAG: hypothetical protein AYK26_07175 [Euryarchaeota archaeon SM23-78]MBW3001022.1 hypothetical protein [Candidatus Woesearchaeota archaeon]
MREEITSVFEEVGRHYKERGVVEPDIHQGHDVHAFYRLSKEPSQVIHVQGYPGLSDEKGMYVWARLLDYDKMMEIRQISTASIGNEHGAFIKGLISQQKIAYDSKILEEKLAENVPELKQ